MSADTKLLESCILIRNDPRFEAFRNYLKNEMEVALKVLVGSQDDRAMHVAQGAYNALKRVFDLVEESPRLLDKRK